MHAIRFTCLPWSPRARARVGGRGAIASMLGLALCLVPLLAQAAAPPRVSAATTMDQAGMDDIRSLVPDMSQEIAYMGSDNFVGAPVDGYEAPRCWLKRDAAEALARVDADLRERNMRLRIYDCYRPARAVAHFVRWAHDLDDQRTKPTHYPNLDKTRLLDGYIASVSGHSRGRTVDLTVLRCDDKGGACEPLDMGTHFDYFGTRANTDSPEVSAEQLANRHLLRDAMQAHGFANYPMEWWHYTLAVDGPPGELYDVPVTAPTQPAWQAELDRLMAPYDGDVPGAALLVLKDGKPLVRRGYGRSDLERETEAGPETNYRLASVSKAFTAGAVLLLAQDGKLSIDDPVRKWLPSLPEAADAITLHHLLAHTSGVIEYDELAAKPYEGQLRDIDVLRLLEAENRLYFEPGSSYRYSNSGYALLALVIERASGMGFPDYLRTRIFEPLGMRDSLAYVAGGADVPRRAWGYSQTPEGWERTDQNHFSQILGDGGVYSSLDDMARWDAAWNDDRLFSDATRALAFGRQVQVSADPEPAFYGYGWRVADGRQWHNGESIGFRNSYVRWPEQGLSVILLSNRNDPTPYPTAVQIGELILRERGVADP